MDVAVGAIGGPAVENAAGLGGAPFRRTHDLEDEVHRRRHLLLQHALEQFEFLTQGGVGGTEALDLAHRVQHGGVITSAEAAADLRQRTHRERLRQVHSDLARLDYDRGAPRGQDVLARDAVMTRNELLYVLDLDPLRLARADEIADRDLRGNDHLPARIDQRIEGMTKFSLDDLSLKELSVIEYQEIDRPQGFLECDRGLRLQRRDEPIHEFFGCQINDGAPLRGRRMREGLQQMRLAQAHRGVEI